MAVSAVFKADFSSFQQAVEKANVSLRSFETGATKVEKSLNRMSNSLSGQAVIQQAQLMATAVDKIGGVSSLTAKELARLGPQAAEAAEKMARMGLGVDKRLTDIAAAAKKAEGATVSWSSVLGKANSVLATFGVGLSVGAAVSFGKALLDTAGQITDLSAATGVARKDLQELAYVGSSVGVSMEEIGRGVGQLSKRLAGGDEGAAEAVQKLGLNLRDLIASGPKEAFVEIGEAVGRVKDPMERNALAAELFSGRLADHLIPLLGNLREEMNKVPKDAIISDEQLARADEFGDKLAALTIRVKAWAAANVFPEREGESLMPENSTLKEQAELLKYVGEGRNWAAAALEKYHRDIELVSDAERVNNDTMGRATDIEKVHADMREHLARKTEEAAEAQNAWRVSVQESTVAANLGVFALNKYGAVELPNVESSLRGVNRELEAFDDNLRQSVQQIEGTSFRDFNGDLTRLGQAASVASTGVNDLITATQFVGPTLEQMGFKEVTVDVGGLAQSFAQFAQIAGGSMGDVTRAIGSVIAGIDTMQESMKLLNGSAASTMAGLAGFVPIIGQMYQAFRLFDSLDGPNNMQRMAEGFGNVTEYIKSLVQEGEGIHEIIAYMGTLGFSADEAKAKLKALYEASRDGGKEAAAALREFQQELDRLADIKAAAGKYGLSESELDAAADKAREVFDFMLESGEYTAEQLARAYYDMQKAMADAGDAAAAAWVKAHDAVEEGAESASAAISALVSERDRLMESYANEAPEEHMGVIEAAARAQVEALNAQIEDAQQQTEQAAAETANSFRDASDLIEGDLRKIPEEAEAVRNELDRLFDGMEYTVRVGFDVSGAPAWGGAQAKGGDYMVTKPTLFMAGEAGPERATFTPAGGASSGGGWASGSGVLPPIEITLVTENAVIAKASIDGLSVGGRTLGRAQRLLVPA